MNIFKCERCGHDFISVKTKAKFCSCACSNVDQSGTYAKALLRKKQYSIWSCGGGVDSVAIAVLICQGKIEKPDYAVMTDNSYDGTYTWDYVDGILKPELIKVGVELNIIKTNDYTSTELIDGKGYVRIPAHTKKDGQVIKFDTRCSNRWKVIPAMRWIKEQGVKRCVNIVGIARDERQRMKKSGKQWIEYSYPLVGLNYARRDCIRIIKDIGWPVPERSSCIICPNRTDGEWLDLRDDHKEDWERAVKIEAEMREQRPDVFFHSSCKPLSEADFSGGGYIPYPGNNHKRKVTSVP